jgi:hypothetical protein
MKPKHLVAIVTAIFAASTYAASGPGGDVPSGGKPAQNGATNDMDTANPNKGLPRDSTQEHDGRYKEKSSTSKSKSHRSGSGSAYDRGSGTERGTEGPGSGSKNKD